MFGRNKLKSWAKLESLYSHFKKMQMKDLFASDERRADKYTIQFENLLLDYSKNRIDDKIMAALFDLARERDVCGSRRHDHQLSDHYENAFTEYNVRRYSSIIHKSL